MNAAISACSSSLERPLAMLMYWNARKTPAPASALNICATRRVFFGPIRRKRAVTVSRARAVAAKASVTRKTMEDSHSGEENIASHSSGGPSRPA